MRGTDRFSSGLQEQIERDRSRYIAQVQRSGVATIDQSKPRGPELDLEKSMDMTGDSVTDPFYVSQISFYFS